MPGSAGKDAASCLRKRTGGTDGRSMSLIGERPRRAVHSSRSPGWQPLAGWMTGKPVLAGSPRELHSDGPQYRAGVHRPGLGAGCRRPVAGAAVAWSPARCRPGWIRRSPEVVRVRQRSRICGGRLVLPGSGRTARACSHRQDVAARLRSRSSRPAARSCRSHGRHDGSRPVTSRACAAWSPG